MVTGIEYNVLREKIDMLRDWEDEMVGASSEALTKEGGGFESEVDRKKQKEKRREESSGGAVESEKLSVGSRQSGGGRKVVGLMSWRKWVGVAASVGLIGVMIWVNQRPGAVDKLFQENFQIYPQPFLTRSNEGTQQDRLQKAYVHYEKKEFAKAIPFLESLVVDGHLESELYLAISYLGSNRIDYARTLLNKLNATNSKRKDIVMKYLCLCDLKQYGKIEYEKCKLTGDE